MNATRREMPGGLLEETAPYAPRATDGDGPPAPRGAHRYSYSSGARPLEGYTIKRAIGRGGFGEVYFATSDAGKEVALKLITRNIDIERRGVQHCMNLKSPNLITIYDLKTNDDGETWVVMEYVAGPNLAQILAQHPKGLPLEEVRRWMKGLVDGVSYLHEHGIVHRDLKPGNLFLEDGIVKIGDYGLSKSIAGSQNVVLSENVGTCYYMAPEISTGKYHQPIDIYAMGCILYEMLTGKVPFDGESTGEVLMKHLTSLPDVSPLPEPFRGMVRRALAKDPNHRPPRAQDLLIADDLPPTPEIRIIEKGTAPDPLPGQAHAEAAAKSPGENGKPRGREDVLVIGPEEPIFYIGPDTMPPRSARHRGFRARLNGLVRGAHVPPPARLASTRRPAPPVRAMVNRPPRPMPEPPPELPPPLPFGRLRVAELAGSMLWSAPLAAFGSALCLPAFEALDVGLPANPMQLAFLFTMTLLGAWGILGTAKWWEGRGVPWTTRRLTMLLMGLGLGITGLALASWLHLGPMPAAGSSPFRAELVRWSPGDATSPAAFASYFALVFGLNPWWTMIARDRISRFRFWPVIKSGLLAALLGAVLPSPQPWGVMVVVLIAILVQIVSPWNRTAARYARWQARQAKYRALAA